MKAQIEPHRRNQSSNMRSELMTRRHTFCRPSFSTQLICKHLSYVCYFLPLTRPQSCYYWAAEVNQTDKRLHFHYRYKCSTSSESRNSAFLQQPFYKLLTQRLWSVIEAAIFPWRLRRSLPRRPAGTNYLTLMRARLSFQGTARSKKGFLLFLYLVWFMSHSRLTVKIWTLCCCALSAFCLSFTVKALQCCSKTSGKFACNMSWSPHIMRTYRWVWVQKLHQAFHNSDFSDSVSRYLYCVAICWRKLNLHTFLQVAGWSLQILKKAAGFTFCTLCEAEMSFST